jgi:hypothetical protein
MDLCDIVMGRLAWTSRGMENFRNIPRLLETPLSELEILGSKPVTDWEGEEGSDLLQFLGARRGLLDSHRSPGTEDHVHLLFITGLW